MAENLYMQTLQYPASSLAESAAHHHLNNMVKLGIAGLIYINTHINILAKCKNNS
jgi:hypothetical protein